MEDMRFLSGSGAKAMAGLMIFGFLSAGAQAATVTIDVHDAVVAPGETFTVDVVGNGFTDGLLTAWGLNIDSFDAAVVSANSVVVPAGTWEGAQSLGIISATSIVDIGGFTFGAGVGGDPILLATVEFTAALVAGVTSLGLSEWGAQPFVNDSFVAYPNLSFDQTATITVAAVPVPAAVWLFGSALGLLGFVRRRMQIS